MNKFSMGALVATPNALNQVPNEVIADRLKRHVSGDWGELDAHDKKANDAALKHGGRLFSSYNFGKGEKFWIITEADRSATTVLMPEDY